MIRHSKREATKGYGYCLGNNGKETPQDSGHDQQGQEGGDRGHAGTDYGPDDFIGTSYDCFMEGSPFLQMMVYVFQHNDSIVDNHPRLPALARKH